MVSEWLVNLLFLLLAAILSIFLHDRRSFFSCLDQHIFAKLLDIRQLGQLLLIQLELASVVDPGFDFVDEGLLILSSLHVFEQFDLAFVLLVVVHSLHFVDAVHSVPPNEQVHE